MIIAANFRYVQGFQDAIKNTPLVVAPSRAKFSEPSFLCRRKPTAGRQKHSLRDF
jgi:hypothetical protein